MPPEIKKAVLRWCSRFGLLGLLPHQVQLVRMGSMRMWRDFDDEWPAVRQLEPKVIEPWSEVHMIPIGGEPVVELLTETWASYFPDILPSAQERYDYPAPLSEKFWMEYAEPLDEYLRIAKYIGNAVTRLRAGAEEDDIIEYGQGILTRTGAVGRLNCLAVASRRVREGRGFETRWVSPSLLAMLAVMAQQDLVEGRFICQCPCGTFVSSPREKTHYCSPRHRELYKKRAQRARSQEERRERRRTASRNRARTKGR